MTAEEETALRDEQELAEAEKEFSEKINEQTKEETDTRNQQILIALGFTPHYHDKDKEGNDETNFSIRVMNTKIGVKFNDKNPAGLVWAYELTESNKRNFYKNGNLKQIPLIQKYRTIQEGKESVPETTVTGKIVKRRGGAIIIEITENGEKKECSFGLGAVKKDDDGAFIPAGFSKATEKNPEQKMDIPRDIRLPDYGTQLAQAPATDTTKEKPVLKEKEEKVDKGTVADKIPTPEPREEAIATIMKTYLEKGREMVEQIFPELEQPQLSELSQDIATSMFIEDRKEARKERW